MNAIEGADVRALLIFVLCLAAGTLACSQRSKASPSAASMTVTLSPVAGQSVSQGGSLNITAQTSDASGAGVSWTLAGDGALVNPTTTSVTYVAPTTSIGNNVVVVTATAIANSGAEAYIPITLMPRGALANVQAVSVDGGPVSGKIYPNRAYTSVTLCVPGSTTCQTIDGIMVDTGSVGLRVLSSQLQALPKLTDSGGNAVAECVQFPDQSYLWGDVVLADLRIAGEVAGSLSIHALLGPNESPAPSACSNGGAGANIGAQDLLGANGILGVGYNTQDCGDSCAPSGGAPEAPNYYSCSGAGCVAAFVPVAQQITNPIVMFAKDNNGMVLGFPGLSQTSPTLDGQMVFGIGTQPNNPLGNAAVFTVDAAGNFTTNLASTSQSLTSSQVNSGVSALFFPDGDFPGCAVANSFFCPPASTSIAAVQIGGNNMQSTINFQVDNADTLFSTNPGYAAFATLAGPNGTGSCSQGTGACRFEWGLPFFYGRTVFTSISSRSVPAGAPLGPWFAYTTGFTKQ
jgi:hypothetical protein